MAVPDVGLLQDQFADASQKLTLSRGLVDRQAYGANTEDMV